MAEGEPRRGPGRPPMYDRWGVAVWDALWKVHPNGLTPKELRDHTGLSAAQVLGGTRYLRRTFREEPDPPVIYVRSENHWFIAPTWGEHTRQAIRSEYLQQSVARLHSAEQLLSQAQRAFPAYSRQIRKIMRNAAYLREEAEDLVEELQA